MRTLQTAAAIVFGLTVFCVMNLITGSYSEERVIAACVAHGGVQQVMDGGPTTLLDASALVICKDGFVAALR